jgi:hypothetical protein
MRRLIVFNSVSLDGYFVDPHGDMCWSHNGMVAALRRMKGEPGPDMVILGSGSIQVDARDERR